MRQLLSRAVVLACVGLVSAFALAEGFDLDWHTVDGGGGRSVGSGFELTGTIGQPDAGGLEGGGFQLIGGFWFETPPGDCDFDGITNLAEFSSFAECTTVPIDPVDSGCQCFDVDRDGHVDLVDFARLQNSFNGR